VHCTREREGGKHVCVVVEEMTKGSRIVVSQDRRRESIVHFSSSRVLTVDWDYAMH